MSAPPSFTRQLVRLVVFVVAAVVVVGLVDRVGVQSVTERAAGSTDLRWIWATGDGTGPQRFHVGLDVETALPAAVLRVSADSNYSVFVDGRWLASNRFRAGTWDEYEVGDLLSAGPHRIDVEIDSVSDGTGGLLLCLAPSPGDRCLVTSDDRWTVSTTASPEPVIVWRPTWFGRWQVPSTVERRPRVDDCFDLDRPVSTVRVDREGEGRSPVKRLWWRRGHRGLVVVETDGTEVDGGRIRFGSRRGPASETSERELSIAEGRTEFRVLDEQRVRFLVLIGADAVTGARLYPRRESCEVPFTVRAAASPATGLFGLVPSSAALEP